MNSGMYAALSGNLASQQRLEVLTNNLANVNTPGFKRDNLLFESMLAAGGAPGQADGPQSGTQVMSGFRAMTDFTAGPVRQSGNNFDLALEGDGFFVVQTPQGKAYTRQGNFHLDAGGKLVTADGHAVLGGGKPVMLSGGRVEISARGEVSAGGRQLAVLDVVDFPRPYELQKSGSTLFIPAGQDAGELPARNTQVRQGFLEGANVNPVLEMARLIESTRYYESCLKAVRSYDDMAAKAANDLGKV